MLANYITLARFPLLVIYLAILYRGSPATQLAGVGLLLVGLMLDTVDGVVARKTGSTSLIGGVLDIAADRSYELALWVCFADLGLIPAAIPLIIILRTTLTDALRSLGVAGGAAPLDQPWTGLARFLVASTWMRSGYSVTKALAFCGLALTRALGGLPPRPSRWISGPRSLRFGNRLARGGVLSLPGPAGHRRRGTPVAGRLAHHRDFDARRMPGRVPDAVGLRPEVGCLRLEDVGHLGLRVAVVERKPGALHLHHDPVALA